MTIDQVAQLVIGGMLGVSMWMQRRNDAKTERARRASEGAARAASDGVNKISEVAKAMDGNLTKIIELSEAVAMAAGIKIGREQQAAEQKAAEQKAAEDKGPS